jgi:hypothetical protein
MDTKVFNRIEKKYLISKKQKKEILKEVQKKMKKDEYFKSGVMNIYFDTDNFDLIIKSIDNPDFKEKLRARSYEGYDKVFLEIKTKIKESEYRVGFKRRFLITHQDFDKLIAGEKTALELAGELVETNDDLQIAKEVDHMISHFALKPKVFLYYDRESYVDGNGLRITFDENLSYRDSDLNFIKKSSDKKYFKNGTLIMEIKAHGVMPLWLAQLLSKEKAYPTRFSKIGMIYNKLRKEK